MIENKSLETWAVVEVMGHKRFAGFVTEQAIAGAAFVRVDVPEIPADSKSDRAALPAFTKLLGAPSIYAITPCTEETARAFAAKMQERAFATYEAPRLIAPQPKPICEDDYPEDEEEDDIPI